MSTSRRRLGSVLAVFTLVGAGCGGAQVDGAREAGEGSRGIAGGPPLGDAIVVDATSAEVSEGPAVGSAPGGGGDVALADAVEATEVSGPPPADAPSSGTGSTSFRAPVSAPPLPGGAAGVSAPAAPEPAPTMVRPETPARDTSRIAGAARADRVRPTAAGGERASRTHAKAAPGPRRRPPAEPAPERPAPAPAEGPVATYDMDVGGRAGGGAGAPAPAAMAPPRPSTPARSAPPPPPAPRIVAGLDEAGAEDDGAFYAADGEATSEEAAGVRLGAATVAPDLRREATVARQVARRLTAGTVGDLDRRPEYLDFLSRHPGEAMQLGLDMSRRVRFRIVDSAGRPVNDARLTLVGQPAVRVAGRTHADGYWDFFPGVSAPQAAGPVTLYIQTGSLAAQAQVAVPAAGDGRDVIVRLPGAVAAPPRVLDLAFLIDVTGSMGDELAYVNEEVTGIVDRVRAAVPSVTVRVAATFYRDRGDALPLEQIPFSPDVTAFMARMRYVEASGGGDYPEDLNSGLAAALTTLDWSEGPAARVLVLIADAPPHQYPDFQWDHHQAMATAAERGIRILPVAASGADRVVEFLFRAMGTFTSSPYVYLTDDSGIGGRHMEADTERVSIEMFSDCLTRLLISDLQGQGMHEPAFAPQGIVLPQG